MTKEMQKTNVNFSDNIAQKISDSEYVVVKNSVPEFINICKTAGITILGVEGLIQNNEGYSLDTSCIADFSNGRKVNQSLSDFTQKTQESASKFIEQTDSKNTAFVFVLD